MVLRKFLQKNFGGNFIWSRILPTLSGLIPSFKKEKNPYLNTKKKKSKLYVKLALSLFLSNYHS